MIVLHEALHLLAMELRGLFTNPVGARCEHAAGPVSGDVEYYRTFEQDKVASYETRTPGYDMLNATLNHCFDLGSARAVEMQVRGSNRMNELALFHTSFMKHQSPPH